MDIISNWWCSRLINSAGWFMKIKKKCPYMPYLCLKTIQQSPKSTEWITNYQLLIGSLFYEVMDKKSHTSDQTAHEATDIGQMKLVSHCIQFWCSSGVQQVIRLTGEGRRCFCPVVTAVIVLHVERNQMSSCSKCCYYCAACKWHAAQRWGIISSVYLATANQNK